MSFGISRLAHVFAALAGAALLSQFPAFYDQYLQRLGGRLDQARIEVERIEEAARAERMTVPQYIRVFLTSQRSPVRRHGRIMETQLRELTQMERALAALRGPPSLSRPVRFARYADSDLARATWADFSPALPLGAEGFAYALTGLLGGLLGARGGARVFAALRARATST